MDDYFTRKPLMLKIDSLELSAIQKRILRVLLSSSHVGISRLGVKDIVMHLAISKEDAQEQLRALNQQGFIGKHDGKIIIKITES